MREKRVNKDRGVNKQSFALGNFQGEERRQTTWLFSAK